MRIPEIIAKKKEGKELNKDELIKILNAPDYQLSAFLMAVCFRGMSEKETIMLTEIIKESGDNLNWNDIKGIKVDKHSTGGVGDKISLIVLPIVASLGVPIVKMSGKGLGFTGGTIDKLQSAKGFRTNLTRKEIKSQIEKIGIALISQSGNLTPMDKKLYSLRDITATVDSLPLVASSVMGKKLAFGADRIVLDVKCGRGAFMKNQKDATSLANIMCKIGNSLHKKTSALITRMAEPLGYAIGNALELKEAMEFISPNKKRPDDLKEISFALAAEMLIAGEIYNSEEKALKAVNEAIESGKALKKFKEFISAQEGSLFDIPEASEKIPVISENDGFVSEIEAEKIGTASMSLGAGRSTLDDEIDYSAGIILNKKYGDYVTVGEPLAFIHTNRPYNEALTLIKESYKFSETPPEKPKYIIGKIN